MRTQLDAPRKTGVVRRVLVITFAAAVALAVILIWFMAAPPPA